MRRLGPFAVYSNVFLVMLSLGVISPMLKDIQRDLGVSYGAIAWGVGAFAVARLLADLPAGIAAERYPRAIVLLAGSLAICGGSLVAAWSGDLQTFMLARAISGVGSAITSTVGLTVVLDAAAPEHRGRASARYHSALGAGAFVGPGFGGLLSTLGDWRLALAGAGIAALLSSGILLVVYRSRALEPARHEGITVTSERTAGGGWIRMVLLAAAPAYLAAFAIFFTRGAAAFTLIPLAGRDAAGLSALTLSIVLMASAGVTTLIGPSVGSLSDRLGRERLLVPGLLLMAGGTLCSVAAGEPRLFIGGVALASIAGATFSLPSSMIVDRVPAHARGRAIGLYRMVGDAALSLGPLVAGLVVDAAGFMVAGLAVAGVVVTIVVAGWAPRLIGARRALQEGASTLPG